MAARWALWPASRWRSEAVLEVQREVRDGIPVFWAETSQPDFHAALVFRVGRADEAVPRGGISRLIQFLAFTQARGNVNANHFVDHTRTGFHAQGERDEVLEYLASLTAGLAALPLDRLDGVREQLRPPLNWVPAVPERLLRPRFGAQGFGTAGYREYALEGVDPETVSAWARENFTLGNAVLCLTGPPPEELSLSLPDGTRRPVPALAPLPELEFPLQVPEGTGGVAIGGLAERGAAAPVALEIFRARATEELGPQRRVAHEVGQLYTPLTNEVAQFGFVARCADEKAPEGREGLIHVIESLRDEGPTDKEIDTAVQFATRALGSSAAELAALDRAVGAELMGGEQVQPAELVERFAAVTPESLRKIYGQVAESPVVIVPQTTETPSGWHEPPGPLRTEFEGETFKGPGLFKRRRVVVGSEGVTHHDPDAGPQSIRYSDAVVAVDQTRGLTLVARDASSLTVAADFGDKALGAVRAALPDDLYVRYSDDGHDDDHDHDHAHDHHHHHH